MEIEDTFEKQEYRVIIKFLWSQGKSPQKIHDEINSTLGNGSVSIGKIYKYVKRIKKVSSHVWMTQEQEEERKLN